MTLLPCPLPRFPARAEQRRLVEELADRLRPATDDPGWVGLECVRQEDGLDAWLALQARASDQVVKAFGALDAPAVRDAAAGDVPWVREYTPLATVGWVEPVRLADAVDTASAAVAPVRAVAPLADALADVVGTGTAEALLGPPASSDALVTRAERTLDMGGQRRLWRDGGWPPVAASIHVTQRFDDGSGDRRRIGPASYRAPPPPVVVSSENGSGPRPSANSCS